MAETPIPILSFEGDCPDCGKRLVNLPGPLPGVGDDFDWKARDYDRIRIFMMEELAARFPERTRWTPADIEVVIVEVLAAALDQLSDMADRVASEAYLETARRPESVRRLLKFIGYDAVRQAGFRDDPEDVPDRKTGEEKLEQNWMQEPSAMERARLAGPRAVHDQHRMVTVDDYTNRLEEHPMVLRAAAQARWTGSWQTLYVAVILHKNDIVLDEQIDLTDDLKEEVKTFHEQRALLLPDLSSGSAPTNRVLLRSYIDTYRMAGQEVVLQDAESVGIAIFLSVTVADDYFQSEVQRDVEQVLSSGSGGFFELGRMKFGEDVHASDLFEIVMALDGVENACLTRFKKVGSQYPDQSAGGTITLKGLEIAVCDNDPLKPERGYYRLTLYGGMKG